jgi:hypothetical protein
MERWRGNTAAGFCRVRPCASRCWGAVGGAGDVICWPLAASLIVILQLHRRRHMSAGDDHQHDPRSTRLQRRPWRHGVCATGAAVWGRRRARRRRRQRARGSGERPTANDTTAVQHHPRPSARHNLEMRRCMICRHSRTRTPIVSMAAWLRSPVASSVGLLVLARRAPRYQGPQPTPHPIRSAGRR